jgi:hypothetical protein
MFRCEILQLLNRLPNHDPARARMEPFANASLNLVRSVRLRFVSKLKLREEPAFPELAPGHPFSQSTMQ